MLQWPGKEIEDSKEYKVATLDYLAEGNDHMTALPKWAMRINCCLKRTTVRQLFLNYVNEQTKAGKENRLKDRRKNYR